NIHLPIDIRLPFLMRRRPLVQLSSIRSTASLRHPFLNSLGLSSDLSPVFFPHVFVYLDRRAADIQCVSASALRAGNPIILAGLHTIVVGLETRALEALKRLATVIKCAARLGKRYTPNPSRARESPRLALDIHDASSLCF